MDLFNEGAVASLIARAGGLAGLQITFGILAFFAAWVAFLKTTKLRSPPAARFAGFIHLTSPGRISRLRSPRSTQTDLATFWSRAKAKLIDHLILGVFHFSYSVAIVLIAVAGGESAAAASEGTFAASLVPFLLTAAYSISFHGGCGATPGKLICRIKVVRSDGSSLSFLRAAARFPAEQLSAIILFIGYIMAGFDAEKRTLHDRICDTRVVNAPGPRGTAALVPRNSGRSLISSGSARIKRWPLSGYSPFMQVFIVALAWMVSAGVSSRLSGIVASMPETGFAAVLVGLALVGMLVSTVLSALMVVLLLIAILRAFALHFRKRALGVIVLLASLLALSYWGLDSSTRAELKHRLASVLGETSSPAVADDINPLPPSAERMETAVGNYESLEHGYTLTLPPGWREADAAQKSGFAGGALFQDRSGRVFAAVLVEGSLTETLTKEEVAEGLRRVVEENGAEDVRISELIETIRGETGWIEFRLDARVNDTDFVYRYALHLGLNQTYTIIAWSMASDYPSTKPMMLDLLAGLRLPNR